MNIGYVWRGIFENHEVNALHAEACETRLYSDSEWNWSELTSRHSLGWVTARDAGRLVGFVNVPWDGFLHAWIQDVMVASSHRYRGVGRNLVHEVVSAAKSVGCEWLHVDFDAELLPFYVDACGFVPTNAGLISLG